MIRYYGDGYWVNECWLGVGSSSPVSSDHVPVWEFFEDVFVWVVGVSEGVRFCDCPETVFVWDGVFCFSPFAVSYFCGVTGVVASDDDDF